MDPTNPTSSANASPAHSTTTQPLKAAKGFDNPHSSTMSINPHTEPSTGPSSANQPNNASSHEKATRASASDSTVPHTQHPPEEQPTDKPLPHASEVIETDENVLNAWKIVNWAFDVQSATLPSTCKPMKHAFASTCCLQYLALSVLFIKSEAMFNKTSGSARLAWGAVAVEVYPRLLWITQQSALKQQIANYREPYILTMTDAICSRESENMDKEERNAGITKHMFSLSRLQTAKACWQLLKYGSETVHHAQGRITGPKQINWRIRQIDERIQRLVKP